MAAPERGDLGTHSSEDEQMDTRSSRGSSNQTGKSGGSKTVMGEGYALQEGFKSLPRRPHWLPRADAPEYQVDGTTHSMITELEVVCNSFPVTLSEDFSCEVIKYDVIFDPPIMEDARQREELLEKFADQIRGGIGDHALDNARVYAWRPLGADENYVWSPAEKLEVIYETAPIKKIILQAGQRKPLMEMDLQYQQQVTSVFLRELARQVGWVRMGRNHYDLENVSRRVQWDGRDQGELNMMDGYRMSLEYACTVGQGELINTICLTIDACSRVIDPNTVQSLIDRIHQTSRTPKRFKQELEWELKNRAVVTKYNNKIFKISHVEYELNPHDKMMTDPDDRETTVGDYYRTQYNLDCGDYTETGGVLLVHEMPPRKRDNGRIRHLYLVPEFCQLTGYPPKIRKNHQLMKKLSRKNKLPSDVRAEKCIEAVGKLMEAAVQSNSPIEIDSEIQKINGRILSAAPIFLSCPQGNPKKIQIKDLQMGWKRDGMFDQVSLGDGEWIMVGQPKSAPLKKLKKLYKNMAKQTVKMGKNILGEPQYLELGGRDDSCAWKAKLSAALEKDKGIKAVVAVIPCKSQPTKDDKQAADEKYNAIKEVCSKDHGVHSQCIQSCNLETNHVWTGITRQLFTKLGSLPWKLQFHLHGDKLDIYRIPTMLVGIDVNHDRKSAASPVAFVSTWDRDFVRTHSQLSYHTLANEVMNPTEMKEFLMNAMNNFKKKNRCFPRQVIIYRDGIASTQIEHVQKNEMTGINSALRELGQDKGRKKTKIEFILVNKRVNCRFVEANTLANVPRGLIVDNTVVSSQYWDFYITPADAPEGCTSTPTRFIIIRDELNLSQKNAVLEIESLTKQLCNLYYNWPGPVRVPAIVKNADKLTTQFGSAVNGSIPHARLADTYHFL